MPEMKPAVSVGRLFPCPAIRIETALSTLVCVTHGAD